MIKLTKILSEIKVKPDYLKSAKILASFFNKNKKELAKEFINTFLYILNEEDEVFEGIERYGDDMSGEELYENASEEQKSKILDKVVEEMGEAEVIDINDGGNNYAEVCFRCEVGINFHPWVEDEDELPDAGSYEWDEGSLGNVKFYYVTYSI